MLALVRKGLLRESLHHHLHLLLKKLPVGVPVKHRRPESLHLPRVVAAPHSENNPPAGQNVRHRKILGQPQRMPHRRNVETAAILQPPRVARQVKPQHYQVGDALVPLRLEVMLRHPELVIPVGLQVPGNIQSPLKSPGQLVVGIPAVVGRRPPQPQVVVHNVAGVRCAETLEHNGMFPSRLNCRHSRITGPAGLPPQPDGQRNKSQPSARSVRSLDRWSTDGHAEGGGAGAGLYSSIPIVAGNTAASSSTVHRPCLRMVFTGSGSFSSVTSPPVT